MSSNQDFIEIVKELIHYSFLLKIQDKKKGVMVSHFTQSIYSGTPFPSDWHSITLPPKPVQKMKISLEPVIEIQIQFITSFEI